MLVGVVVPPPLSSDVDVGIRLKAAVDAEANKILLPRGRGGTSLEVR